MSIKIRFCMIQIISILVVLAGMNHQVMANQALEQEIDGFIAIVESNNVKDISEMAEALTWSGITDTRLFDAIEQKLLSDYMSRDKYRIEMNSWLIKALGASANDKYRETIDKLINNNATQKKLRRNAEYARESVDQYKIWNPLLAKDIELAPAGRLMQHRIRNMLQSSDGELIRIGAKRVYHKYSNDKELVKTASQTLLRDYEKSNLDGTHIDALAWICKAIAQSGMSEFVGVLEEVNNSYKANDKVKKYARKYL